MEKETEENPHRLSRREFLKAAGITAAAVGVSQLASSKSQGLENIQGGEPIPPRRWMPCITISVCIVVTLVKNVMGDVLQKP